MKDRKEIAREKFLSGYNCAQSVLAAFSERTGMKEEELANVAAGFGGGMGKLQLTCGAVTGSFILFGIRASMMTTDFQSAKDLSSEMVREFAHEFAKDNESLSCRSILGVDLNTGEGMREAGEKKLFETVCVNAVVKAVVLSEKVLAGFDTR